MNKNTQSMYKTSLMCALPAYLRVILSFANGSRAAVVERTLLNTDSYSDAHF